MATYYVEYRHTNEEESEAALVASEAEVSDVIRTVITDNEERVATLFFFAPMSPDVDFHQNYLLDTRESGADKVEYTRHGLIDVKRSFRNAGTEIALPRMRALVRWSPDAALNPLPAWNRQELAALDHKIKEIGDCQSLSIPLDYLHCYFQSQIIIGIRQELHRRGFNDWMEQAE